MLRFILPAIFSVAAFATGFSGTVDRVLDGDTLAVSDRGYTIRLRLYGVDAPEKAQSGGPEATAFTTQLALNQTVTVVQRDIDRYGRVVCDVMLPDGRVLNREIVKAGHGRWYAKYAPLSMELRALEAEARANRLGLWAESEPQAPWEWRKEEHPGSSKIVRHARRSEPRNQRRSLAR